MKTIQFSSHMGPFAYTATTEIGDDVNAETSNLCVRGLADICFRATANEAMKALVKEGHLAVDGDKKPLSRDKAEFTNESVEVFGKAANAALDKMNEGDEPVPPIMLIVTGKYEPGESAQSRKQAEKFLALYKAAPDAKKAAFALAYGFEPTASDEEVVAAVHAFHSALREPRKAKATTAEAATA